MTQIQIIECNACGGETEADAAALPPIKVEFPAFPSGLECYLSLEHCCWKCRGKLSVNVLSIVTEYKMLFRNGSVMRGVR